MSGESGDKIGLVFTYWTIVYFGHFLNYRSSPIFGVLFSTIKLCIHFDPGGMAFASETEDPGSNPAREYCF
jgi:hypothetical protein